MALSDEFLDDLRRRADIESTVSSYVSLKRKGKILTGLCPFHNEKTPSFTVYPETQSYYCFGCGNGGDVITFIRNIENLDYMEAVKLLADRHGVSMPQDGYDSGLSKLCFPLREIDFVTENSLPARGWKTPPKSSFFTGATVARPEIWPAKDFRDPFARKQGRSGHFGVGKWRFIAPIRHRNSSFSTDFRRLKMQNFGQILRI